MQNFLEIARKLHAAGLTVVWQKGGRFPKWKQWEEGGQTAEEVEALFKEPAERIALICTGNIEAIDIDVKNDPAGTIAEEYFQHIKEQPGGAELLEKCILQKTKSGGYHIIYRAENRERNRKLTTRANAQEAVIETRGAGGLLFVAPSPGYELERGTLFDIPQITPEERDFLIYAALELSDRVEATSEAEKSAGGQIRGNEGQPGERPGDAFNAKNDPLELLEAAGWRVKGGRNKEIIHVTRPGSKSGEVHGSVLRAKDGTRIFHPFTTATAYSPNLSYSAFAIYAQENHGGTTKEHLSAAARALRAQGYGGGNAGTTPAPAAPPVQLYGLKGNPAEVILVQDKESAQAAEAAGLLGVVAIEEALRPAHIKAARAAGAKRFTVCYGTGKEAETFQAVEALLRYQETSGEDFDTFIAQLSDFKNLEQLLRQPGGNQAAEAILRGRWGAARYLAKWLDGTRAPQIAQEVGSYQSDVFRAELIREAVLVERLARPVDVPQLRDLLKPIYQTYGIEPEAIAAAADSVKEMEAAKQYRAELARISQEAAQAAQAGKQEEAERLLWVETREARLKLHAGRFAELLEGHNREEVIKGLNPPALQTSYTMKKQGLEERALELPAGAITVIAAASGHGKTAMLINLILDVCRLHPDKEFHFFSLEESAAAVTAKMLNTFLDLDFSGRNEPALEAYLKGDTRFIKNEYLSELREKEAQFWPLLGKQIFIHYLEQGTAEEFCEAVQWLHRRRNVGAVFADYLQLFGLENRGKLDRQEELKRVCLMLKNTAIETGLPLCFAAQFNREVTTEKKSQEYTKIGEAGDIERVAALILGLWNRSFNPPKKKETEGEQEAPAPADIMAARVLKWRGGPVGYGAAWKWDGNRKRIYPNTTTTGAAAPGAPGAMPAEVKKLLNQ